MKKFLTKMCLLTLCCTPLFASDADESKKSTPKMKRYIISRIVHQPKCNPEKRKNWENNELLADSDNFIKKYAPILPAFAAIQNNSGCLYYHSPSETKPKSKTYYEFLLRCCHCNYSPTFFHVSLVTSSEKCETVPCKKTVKYMPSDKCETICKTVQKIQPTKDMKEQIQLMVLDDNKGMYAACTACVSAEFITTEDPSKKEEELKLQSAMVASKSDDDTFDV